MHSALSVRQGSRTHSSTSLLDPMHMGFPLPSTLIYGQELRLIEKVLYFVNKNCYTNEALVTRYNAPFFRNNSVLYTFKSIKKRVEQLYYEIDKVTWRRSEANRLK